MIQQMVSAFLLIFLAEMGDKTQILAMAFATQFPMAKVMLGIGIGAFLNHGAAVALGSYLSRLVPINTIQMIAGAAFIGFALWTLKPDDGKGAEEKEARRQLGPVTTVALAFFLGELGDKTQLTAITLAADAAYPLMVLIGTVSGMVATGALGIIVGKKLGERIPEIAVKLAAASIFMFFGLQKLSDTVPVQYLNASIVLPFLSLLALLVFWMVYSLIQRQREGVQSELVAAAKMLRDYYQHVNKDLKNMCLGPRRCGACQGDQCPVGKSKNVIRAALGSQKRQILLQDARTRTNGKPFSREKALDCLVDTLWLITAVPEGEVLVNAHLIRNQMETILLGKPIKEFGNITSYLREVRRLDAGLANKLVRLLRT